MNAAAQAHREVDDYLKRLRLALRALPADQADDIVRELRSHVDEFAGGEGQLDRERVADVIARLGDPSMLAGAYLMDNLALRAQATRSPILLLRLVTLWATRSFEGICALVSAFVGYGITLIALGCALFKPFMPDRIGLWVRPVAGDDTLYQLGRVAAPPADARELLGWYIVPLGLIVGAIAFVATTRYLLGRARKYRRIRGRDTAWMTTGEKT